MSKVKLDLCHDEIVVTAPVKRLVHHAYSDKPFPEPQISSYRIEEVFAEKLRALIERMRPRDLFDVVHLYEHQQDKVDKELLLKILDEKCNFKKVNTPTMAALNTMPSKEELKADWGNMLSHQITHLKSWNDYWGKLPVLFKWLYAE